MYPTIVWVKLEKAPTCAHFYLKLNRKSDTLDATVEFDSLQNLKYKVQGLSKLTVKSIFQEGMNDAAQWLWLLPIWQF